MAATTTAQEVLDAAWNILNDDDGTLFYPAADMYVWINEAVEQIRQARPDSIVGSTGALTTITPVSALASVISIDDRWFTAILEWVLFRAFDQDADDRRDQKQAESHRQAFELALRR